MNLSFFGDFLDAMNGKKTWTAVIASTSLVLMEKYHVTVPEWTWTVVGILGAIGLAHKAAKTVIAASTNNPTDTTTSPPAQGDAK